MGSSGKHRVSNEFNVSQYGFFNSYSLNNRITYDGFYPKLKGGLGFSVSGATYKSQEVYHLIPVNEKNITNSYQFDLAYAPKLTFSNEVTWSPSIRFGYNKLSSYFNLIYPEIENHLFYLTLGILRNSKTTFYSFEYKHGINQQIPGLGRQINFQMGMKFDKKPKNRLSSTFLFGVRKEFYKDFVKRSIIGGASIFPEWNIRISSLLLIISTDEIGIGLKRPVWGLNLRSSYPAFWNTTTGTYIREPDRRYIEGNFTYSIGFSYTFK